PAPLDLQASASLAGVAPLLALDPVVKWSKSTFSAAPDFDQVMMTPAVIDLNKDGIPDIVFTSFSRYSIIQGRGSAYGVLRAISGDDGRELWSVTDLSLAIETFGSIAAGDLNGDGFPEILVNDLSGHEMAFDHLGTLLWRSPVQVFPSYRWGGASL